MLCRCHNQQANCQNDEPERNGTDDFGRVRRLVERFLKRALQLKRKKYPCAQHLHPQFFKGDFDEFLQFRQSGPE